MITICRCCVNRLHIYLNHLLISNVTTVL
jgi:hypothetical protein